jgi:hypothetical protein
MRRFLAPLRGASYLGLLGAVVSCGRPAPVVPTDAFVPSDRAAFEAFAASSLPAAHEFARFRWRFEDERLRVSGNGAVRVAPPDTLRADIGAAFGLARSTVVLAGDGVDARPADVVERLLPDRFALWAVLGVLRAPAGPLTVERREVGGLLTWRVTDDEGRVTQFETADGRLVSVTREAGGRATTVLALTRDETDGTVRRARLTDYARSARLDIEITSRVAAEPFPPETWRLGP